MDAAEAELTGTTVAKRLASCNKATRDRALRLLRSWLSSPATSASLSEDDLMKIWKGLFYCVWHSDKVPVQLDLVNRLASLLLAFDLPLAARYLASFLSTIRREWGGIDHLRLDKFYLLIRKFVHQVFALLQKNRFDCDVVQQIVCIVAERTLLVVDKYPAQGVNYHIAQVFLDEIREFLPVTVETLELLLKPFFSVLETSTDKVLVAKIKSNIFDRLLENGAKHLVTSNGGEAADAGTEVEKLGKIALAFGFSKRLFDLASSPNTVQGNRKVLFGLHEGFLKLEKDLEKSRIVVLLAVENGGSANGNTDAFAAELAESESAEQVEVETSKNGEKKSKKRKKAKGASDSSGKKSKKKGKDQSSDSVAKDAVCTLTVVNSSIKSREKPSNNATENENSISFNKIIMSNLQKQFEKVAAEDGMVTPAASTAAKKRKRTKSTDGKTFSTPKTSAGENTVGKSGDKSVKRVRFSMKNNLIWKPHSPLPPQRLRLPPSATPRGSALKKGVPPGPVKETPPTSKKVKGKSTSVKKVVRKNTKSISPAVKRLRKLQSFSA